MSDLLELKKNLELSLGEDLKEQYFNLFKQWMSFGIPMTQIQFVSAVRKILTTQEQVRHHNNFLNAILAKVINPRPKSGRAATDRGCFEIADFNSEYVAPPSPTALPPFEYENRSAAAELFLPDSGFIGVRIAVASWENGLETADEAITEVMVQACQMFVRNIITAMISKKRGYKLRDNKFQYGFGLPVPDPFLRNTNNIIDSTQESKVEVADGDDSFVPKCIPSLENAEQQTGFSYMCGKHNYSDERLTVQLLYDTLRENPKIIGIHSVNSLSLLKARLALSDE